MNKDMENTFNQMAELGGSDERLVTNTTPFINAPLLPKNTRPAPAATDTVNSADAQDIANRLRRFFNQPGDARFLALDAALMIEYLNKKPAATDTGLSLDIDKEWFEKRAAQEGNLEIGAGRRAKIVNLSPEEIAELERLMFEALPQWAQDELTRLRAQIAKPATDTGLVTVGEVDKYPHGTYFSQDIPEGSGLCLRSQAEELLAAERAEKERLAALLHDNGTPRFNAVCERAEKAEADNAAQAARIKELTGDRDSWRRVAEKLAGEKQALEAKLAAAEKEAAAWEANYKALDAQYARAVLGGKPS